MHTLLFSALLLGTAYAVPIQRTSKPVDINPSFALQSKIHEKLSQPKQWYADGPAEVKAGLNGELAMSTPATGKPVKEPGPGEIVDMMDWESNLGDNFRSFLSLVKEKHGSSRKEEPMVPVAPQAPFTNSPSHRDVNWGTKRSVIPPKPKKGKSLKAPEEAEPVPGEEDDEEVTTQLDAEITNEDFEELFSYYSAKHDTRGFQGLQGYLDNILRNGNPPLKSKTWQLEPGALHRRDSSNHSTPRYSWTPETDKKPAISINPRIFNHIAAEYKFDQNPTAINTEDSNISGSLSGAKGFGGGSQATLARQTAGGRGKSGIVGGVSRRDVEPCGVACSA